MHPKRCSASKVCYLHFFIFPRVHLGSSACSLPKHPKWSPSVQSKVIDVKTRCVKVIVGDSIQAGDIDLYFWGFQVSFSCFFINFTIFWPS